MDDRPAFFKYSCAYGKSSDPTQLSTLMLPPPRDVLFFSATHISFLHVSVIPSRKNGLDMIGCPLSAFQLRLVFLSTQKKKKKPVEEKVDGDP